MHATTLVALLALVFGSGSGVTWEVGLMLLVLVGFIFARQVLMPMINHARDAEIAGQAGADLRFKRLHRTSVIINGAQWLAVSAAMILALI